MLHHSEPTRTLLLNVSQFFSLGITSVNLTVQPAELIIQYARPPICLSKGHYCCSELHRELMKTVLTAFQMTSYKLLWHQDAFHLPISLPSVLSMWFFPPSPPLSTSHILIFLHSLIQSLSHISQYAKYLQLLILLSSVLTTQTINQILQLILQDSVYGTSQVVS